MRVTKAECLLNLAKQPSDDAQKLNYLKQTLELGCKDGIGDTLSLLKKKLQIQTNAFCHTETYELFAKVIKLVSDEQSYELEQMVTPLGPTSSEE